MQQHVLCSIMQTADSRTLLHIDSKYKLVINITAFPINEAMPCMDTLD